ncbi:hypothetical protein E1264_09720 [Actinomadura sp. KC216]|nr:hypothetical protein E1264_09720 [Actinomadura sp. KC216]
MVDPAARTSPGSPIRGVPILDADRPRLIVFRAVAVGWGRRQSRRWSFSHVRGDHVWVTG